MENSKLIIGLIAEFNPFHNGHIYLIKKIKEQFPDCFLIVALTSDVTQRGELTVASFEDRKNIALSYGVNKVVQLSDYETVQAAHIFVANAINLLLKENISHLVFGVSDKIADINVYLNSANAILKNNQKYNELVKQNLDNGIAYSKSTALAAFNILNIEKIPYPSDILGFEYVKYIVFNKLKIIPISIKRIVNHKSTKTNLNYASGTEIRKMIERQENISHFSPMKIRYPIPSIKDKYNLFQQIVFTSSLEELSQINLMSEGMESLFKKNIYINNYDEFVNACISKRYTRSRIQRVILSTIFNIKKQK